MGASLEWSARTRKPDERFPIRGAACVIEACDEVREAIGDTLRAMGYVTHDCASGAAGAFIAENVSLQVIVASLALPEESGLKLVRRLRASAPDAVLVALAGDARTGLPHLLTRFAGADAVLTAPPSAEALGGAVCEGHHPGEVEGALAQPTIR